MDLLQLQKQQGCSIIHSQSVSVPGSAKCFGSIKKCSSDGMHVQLEQGVHMLSVHLVKAQSIILTQKLLQRCFFVKWEEG